MKEKLMTIITNLKIMLRYTIFLSLMVLFCACQDKNKAALDQPQPTHTTVKWDMEEGEKGKLRQAWWEAVHRAADGVDWKTVDYKTAMNRHKNREASRSHVNLRGGSESFANGQLSGTWRERGSSNQAGSVIATTYHTEEERVYLVSAGGSLFSGTLDGFDWQVVNQDLKFGERLLEFVSYESKEYLVALINRIPHFSLDRGVTWTSSTGITISDRWGDCFSPLIVNDEIFILSKPSYWDRLKIYHSNDGGQTYQEIGELSSHDQGLFTLFKAHFDDKARLVEKDGLNGIKFSNFNSNTRQFETDWISTSHGFGDARANMTGILINDQLSLYFYNGERRIVKSENGGQTWNILGQLQEGPWPVGLYILPSNPEILLAGGVECHRSINGGLSWKKINTWGEYYGDVVNKLHADIMYFNEMIDEDGLPFLLISNHGGLSISRDGGQSNLNIGLYGLNVSQYYSVRTDPVDSDIIYAGAQDQGFQRGRKGNDDWVDFDQTISGDYGHIVFTENGRHMWTVYPGGWISYYDQPHFQRSPTLSYTIDSDHESVWIPPLIPHPDPTKDIIYAAGGSIDGGEGSFVIEIKVDNGRISATQNPYDFRSASNDGVIGAMAFSPINEDRLFVSTNNGFVFYSEDGGQSFDRGVVRVPESHYLYGTSILPGKTDESIVYVGGSGYSNAPVVKSTDGGRIFRDFSDGLPSTLVFQLASNEDESLIFAATEAGPFVYVANEEKWFDISGVSAPTQTYWCVEYLPDEKIARFGTFGRGIWDFEIEQISTAVQDLSDDDLKAYPNPATTSVSIESKATREFDVINSSGVIMLEGSVNGVKTINTSEWPSGIYHIRSGKSIQSIIKI